MINNEYLTVIEISKEHKVTTRNVRRIISELVKVKSKELLYKDSSNQWRVHKILLSYFKPKRIKKQQYYALTVDPSGNYSLGDIDEIMAFVLEKMDNPNVEINYVVEQKKANGKNHLHCFINCNQKKKLIDNLRLGFSKIGYHQTEIYDLERWKQYITKDGGEIKTLKN